MSWHASSGLRAWLMQRMSALYISLFLLYCLISWALSPIQDYSHWHAWVAHPIRNLFFLLFGLAIMAHAWIGGRDIILDYVKPWWLRFLVLAFLAGSMLILAIWLLRVLLTLEPV